MLNFSESFSSIREWAHRRQVRAQHKTTLKKYTAGVFDYPFATITIGDALEQGILDPQCLQGDELVRIMPRLDERVWNAWHESSLHRIDVYKHVYGGTGETLKKNFSTVYANLMDFEKVIYAAGVENGVGLLRWLHKLEAPWRPIEWQPAQLVGGHRNVGNWTLDTFDNLKLSRRHAEIIAKHFLWDEKTFREQGQTPEWIRSVNNSAFKARNWSIDPHEQQKNRAYAQRLFDKLLTPDRWDWKRRWDLVGKSMALAVDTDNQGKQQHRVSSFQGAMMAALLHEAPIDVQIILCAFKRARHPDEPKQGHPDAQFIRHHFFNEPPPPSPPSALIASAFLFVNSVDPDVEVGFVLEQLLRDPNQPVESYALDELNLVF